MPLNTTAKNFKKIVDGLAPHMRGVSDFDDLTNRPLESDAIDIDDLDLPMPAKPTEYPVLFDKSGTEYQVGLYKRASDGKVKPIYRKDFEVSSISSGTSGQITLSGIDKIIKTNGTFDFSNGDSGVIPYGYNGTEDVAVSYNRTNAKIYINNTVASAITNVKVSLEYTKTTDEWKEV